MAPQNDLDHHLTLAQWLSPSFPLGGFAYSAGLETVMANGQIRTGEDVKSWLQGALNHGGLRIEIAALGAVMRGAPVHAMTDLMAALAPSSQRWQETIDMGQAFCRTVRAISPDPFGDHADLPLPVALGLAARAIGAAPEAVAAHQLQAFCSAQISAAVRFIPLGQSEGQRVLTALRPEIMAAAAWVTADPMHLTSFALGGDLAAMTHETLDVRLYRS